MDANLMDGRPDTTRTRSALRAAKLLVGAYLGVSLLTLVAIVLMRNRPAEVNDAVWVRGTIVSASALLSFLFAVRAARGSRGALRRLRIISAVMVVAIVAIIVVPGTFPLWMKIDQGACGLLLLTVAVLVNARHVRTAFAGGTRPATARDGVQAGRG